MPTALVDCFKGSDLTGGTKSHHGRVPRHWLGFISGVWSPPAGLHPPSYFQGKWQSSHCYPRSTKACSVPSLGPSGLAPGVQTYWSGRP
jgi:hypothetical protein